jgi:Ca2+-binding EF-hand superfamily protein
MIKFNTEHLLPYFKAVYQDLLIRSAPSKDQKPTLVDHATIAEFANLPGILSERFWALLSNQAKDPRATQSSFCQVMQRLYSSQVEEKMSLAFQTYDFDNDG